MKTKKEIKDLLRSDREILNAKIEHHRMTKDKRKKRMIHNSIMHYDGRIYAYKLILMIN